MLARVSGFNPKGPYLSLEKEKETFCVAFTYSVKLAREISRLHVPVVQRWLRNVQKKRDARENCCFANLNLSGFFCRSRYCRRPRCLISALLLSSNNLATMVT